MNREVFIGIIGKSAQKDGDINPEVSDKARQIGQELALLCNKLNIFFGAGSG